MALILKNIIDFNLLSIYDKNIKDYISKQKQILFTSRNKLPPIGEEDILYVTVDDGIYIWDSEYIKIGDSGSGDSGIYFTPSVDEEGNLSWTNNGGLNNPPPVNISGPEGASVINVALNEEEELICLLSNGTLINAGQISKFIVFVNSIEELPSKGQSTTLYIVGKTIYAWNGLEYITLTAGSGEGSNPQWGTF